MWGQLSKALIAALSLISITFTAMPALAAATPKPGASCSPYKSTKIVKTVKYTCIKNAKAKPKYVWNKGVTIVAKPIVQPPISMPNLDTSRVRSTAYAEVLRELSTAASYVPKVIYVLGPSLSEVQRTKEQRGLEAAAAFWSSIYKPTSVAISYFNAADVSVIDGLACQIAQYCTTVGGKISEMIQRDVEKSNGSSCNSAFATQYSATQQLFAQCLGPGNDDVKNRQTTPHEYTHFAQQSTFNMNSPVWFIEGSAAYFGSSIGSHTGGAGIADMDRMVYSDTWGMKQQTLVDMSAVTEESVLKAIRRSYDRQGSNDGHSLAFLSYYIGSQCTEIMVALWGMPKLKHFMTQISTLGFEPAFEAEYGVAIDDFYKAAAKYVVAMYEERR